MKLPPAVTCKNIKMIDFSIAIYSHLFVVLSMEAMGCEFKFSMDVPTVTARAISVYCGTFNKFFEPTVIID
jgi:hypothetical protein